jgi:hypothetical protein
MDVDAIAASVSDKVVSGALFDFMGRLTTLDEPIAVGGSEECSPILDVAEEWAEERGLDLGGADVTNWNDKRVSRELVEVAKMLDGTWVPPDANMPRRTIEQRYRQIRSIPDISQRAQLSNMVSEIAVRNRDRFGLTHRDFRGWGRGDFINLTKMINP